MNNKYYVYSLCYPITLVPFYIGKGSGSRGKVHLCKYNLNKDTNPLKINVIKKIQRNGKEMVKK